MAERTWCPSLSTQQNSGALLSNELNAGASSKVLLAAKRDAAVAAHSDASALAQSDSLAASFQRRFHKFDAAVVNSNANRRHWPAAPNPADLQPGNPPVPAGFAVCTEVKELRAVPTHTPLLALPTDRLAELLALLARRGAAGGQGEPRAAVTGLVCTPSSNHVSSLSDVLGDLLRAKHFTDTLEQLYISDAVVGDEPSVLSAFAQQARKLSVLALMNCELGSDAALLAEALKDTQLSTLTLERCSIGCGPADGERETVVSAMAGLLKANKFLTALDLSYTGLEGEAVASLIGALVESDTQMLPQDVEDKADNFDPLMWPERLNAAKFKALSGKRKGRAAADEEDEEMEEEEVEQAEADSQEGSGAASDAGDEAQDGDDEEEDEEEDDEEADAVKASPKDAKAAAAAKAQKKREREEARARERQHKELSRRLVQLVRQEPEERGTLLADYLDGLRGIVSVNGEAVAQCYAGEKQKAKEAYCLRRSGWSRLQRLLLRGNKLGDAGAKQVALVLREEVPLSDDEARQRQETADAARGALVAAFGRSRAATTAAEARARELLCGAAQAERARLTTSPGDPPAAGALPEDEEEEEDEFAKEAPPVLLTNVEGGLDGDVEEDAAAAGGDDVDGESAEERKRWEDWAADGAPPVAVAPVKAGMRSVTVLDLGSCHIGRSGLLALSEVLRTNTVLESLCLRHNPIGGAAAKAPSADQDAAGALSAGFASFVDMLRVNRALRALDLGYCSLGPEHVRAVAAALGTNVGLTTLGLEGNQLGADAVYERKEAPHSYLHDLCMAAAQPQSTLRHLHLSHNPLALCLWPEEAAALAAACCRLEALLLSHVGLQASHLQLWSAALTKGQSSRSEPALRVLHLGRNELAGEAAGVALGALLQQLTALEDLTLDEHPQLGSAGVAAALEHLPPTLRRLSCSGTGLTEPFVGAVQAPVIPLPVAQQLRTLILADVEAPTAEALRTWVEHVAEAAPHLQFLSLWSRGMAGKEGEIVASFVRLAQSCPSLLYVDCGLQLPPRSLTSTHASPLHQLESILVPRRLTVAQC